MGRFACCPSSMGVGSPHAPDTTFLVQQLEIRVYHYYRYSRNALLVQWGAAMFPQDMSPPGATLSPATLQRSVVEFRPFAASRPFACPDSCAEACMDARVSTYAHINMNKHNTALGALRST